MTFADFQRPLDSSAKFTYMENTTATNWKYVGIDDKRLDEEVKGVNQPRTCGSPLMQTKFCVPPA